MCIQHQELFRDYGHRCLWEFACCDDLLRCWLGPGGSQDSFPVSLQHDGICPGCDRARRRALNLDAEEDRRQRELYEARYRPARDEMLRQLRLRRRWEEQLRMERAWHKRDWEEKLREEKLRAEKGQEERQLEEEQVEVKRQEGQRYETQLPAATCERAETIRSADRQVKRQRQEDQDQHGLPSKNGTSTDQEEDERWRNKRRRMETPYDDDDEDEEEDEDEEDSVESET